MLENKEQQRAPSVTFRTRANGEWGEINTDELFAGKTVVIFALPGAYTPTCSSTHLPRFQALAKTLKANGVDTIACLSVNDAFVMDCWGREQEAQDIVFLPDGNGEFSRQMGMLVDKSDLGFGPRSWRYSMLVKDGVIDKMFIEPEVPGDPFEVSDADTMLNYINANAVIPDNVSVFTKPGCDFCKKAKAELAAAGQAYHEIVVGEDLSQQALAAVSGAYTVPQVYINGKHIGGSEELSAYLKG
jgi:glutaredoxin-like protein